VEIEVTAVGKSSATALGRDYSTKRRAIAQRKAVAMQYDSRKVMAMQ